MELPCKTCTRPNCPGFGNPGACAGTLETEAHPDRMTEEELDQIVEYQLECFHESKVGLPFNGRYLLSMIIEIREHRALEAERTAFPNPCGPNCKGWACSNGHPPITFTAPRTKPLDEVTAADIPRGMSAEDVAFKPPTCSKCDQDLEYVDDGGYWHCVTPKGCDGVIAGGPPPPAVCKNANRQGPCDCVVCQPPKKYTREEALEWAKQGEPIPEDGILAEVPMKPAKLKTKGEWMLELIKKLGVEDLDLPLIGRPPMPIITNDRFVIRPDIYPNNKEDVETLAKDITDWVIQARDKAQAKSPETRSPGGFAAGIRDHINSNKPPTPCCRAGYTHDELCPNKNKGPK